MQARGLTLFIAAAAAAGCAQLRIQAPGVQVGSASPSAPGQTAGTTTAASHQVDLSTPKSGHATIEHPNDLGDMEHDLAMGRGPQRLADCSKTPADKNAAQPSEDEQGHLQKGLGLFPHDILNIEPRIKGLQSVAEYEKLIADAEAKYGPWWCSAEYQGQPGLSAHESQMLKLVEKIAMFKKSEWGDPAQSKAEFEKALATADTELGDYLKGKRDSLPDRGDSLHSPANEVQAAINQRAVYYYEQLKMMLGEANPDVVAMKAKLDGANARLASAISTIDDAMADGFRLPKSTYTAKDAAAVRAAFMKSMGDKKVVKVVLTSDWSRNTGSSWQGNKLVNYDNSWIHANVVTPIDAKNAEVWEVIARKDHLDGDKIKFDTYIPRSLGKMRLSNLKK